jgi:hypothetical protein
MNKYSSKETKQPFSQRIRQLNLYLFFKENKSFSGGKGEKSNKWLGLLPKAKNQTASG